MSEDDEEKQETTSLTLTVGEIEHHLEAAVDDLLAKDLDDEVLGILLKRTLSFSGPIPPPEILRQYEELVPGSAERLIIMAEETRKESQRAASKELGNDRLKILLASLVSIFLIAAAVYCGIIGQTAIGVTLGGSGIVSALMTWRRRGNHNN